MEDFNYQVKKEFVETPTEEPPLFRNDSVERKEVLKQWFPFSRIGIFYLCVLLGTTLVTVVVSSLLSSFAGAAAVTINQMAILMAISYAVTIPLCMLIVKAVPQYEHVQKEKWGIGKLLFFLMISLGLMMFGNIISQIGQTIVNMLTGHQMTNPLGNILNDSNIIGSIVMVVIIAPIVEEFLFRKVLLDRVRVYGDKVAILLSGILFGLFHGNIFQVIYATLLGMVLAYVYLKTSRIEYCIGLHMVINTVGGVLPLLLMQGVDMEVLHDLQVEELINVAPQLMGLGTLVLVEIGCMIAAVAVLIIYRKRMDLRPGEIEIASGQGLKTIYLNVGMILFFAACLMVFIANAMV